MEKITFLNYVVIRISMKKITTKTKILPKARKIKFSITFQVGLSLEKATTGQNQDIARSSKNPIFNCFLINISIAKSNHQNQDIAKTRKIKFSITFEVDL